MDTWALVAWIGRIFFVAMFVMSGIGHLVQLKGMTAYAQSKGVPAPSLAVAGTGVMLLVAAAMILTGWNAFWGAWLLVLFLVPTAFMMHNYWVESDPMMRANQQAHFWKNITIAAGAVLYAVCLRGVT
jgi:uncharacterized membrane protein YphA (DoxX/SURF4 family)